MRRGHAKAYSVFCLGIILAGCMNPMGTDHPPRSSPPNGIHVICLKTYKRANYAPIIEGILDLDYISGLLVYLDWADFEPEEGQRQWSFMDLPLRAAQARGKVVSFGLIVQASSPAWVKQRCATFTFEHIHPSVGTVTSPVPWDEAYTAALSATIRALGARYDGHPALHYMVINGPSSLAGVETNFPSKQLAPEEAAKLDYTHERFEAGWKASINLFTDVFKASRLSLGLHRAISLGEGGHQAHMRVARAIRDYAIEREATRNGKRLIVRLLGLATEHPHGFAGPYRETGEATTDYLALATEVRGRADIAFEAARIWRLSNVGGRQKPLPPSRLRRVLELGESHHASWLEIKDLDVWNMPAMAPYQPYAAELASSHDRLRSRGKAPVAHKPMLLAVYYTWYSTGFGPHGTWSSWNHPGRSLLRPDGCDPDRVVGPADIRDISSCAYPLVGVYDSDDREIVRWHMRLAQAAGIDGFLVDWWGPGNWQKVPGLTHDVFVNTVLPVAEEEGFKVALFDETAQFVKDFGQVKTWAADYLARFKDSPAYLRIGGEPVYVVYQVPYKPSLTPETASDLHEHVEARVGPVYWILDKIANGPDPASGGFPSFVIGDEWLALDWVDAFCAYGTFSVQRVHGYTQLTPRFSTLSWLAHEHGHRVMLPVHPGHDNSKLTEKPWVIPRRDGQTLREYLHAAEDAKADLIMVTSFNEWPETTVVEPASTWPDPYQYLRILADWKGVEFRKPIEPGQ